MDGIEEMGVIHMGGRREPPAGSPLVLFDHPDSFINAFEKPRAIL